MPGGCTRVCTMTERPSWTIARAATECNVSRDTIKRRRLAGAFPNAYQDANRTWLIPITDLLAAGFQPTMHKPADPVQETVAPVPSTMHDDLKKQVEILEVKLEAEQQLRAAAERNAADLRQSLRIIEAAPPQVKPEVSPVTPAKRSWWRR
jgi:hypothetical protein